MCFLNTNPNDMFLIIYNKIKNIFSIPLVKSKLILQYGHKHSFSALNVLAYVLHLLYQLLKYVSPFLVVLFVLLAF